MVYCCFDVAGSIIVRRTFTDLGVTTSEVLNEGMTLAINAAYIFAIPVSENETINFHYSQTAKAIKVTVIESHVE